MRCLVGFSVLLAAGCAGVTGAGPKGSSENRSESDTALLAKVGGEAAGKIVWSSSRRGNHDLFVINTDGSGERALTEGDTVDWFPRFSPDGARILFVRSRKGWVSERDANTDGKWDLFTISPEGGVATKVADNASWGTWVDGTNILFVRGTKLFRKNLESDQEKLLVDSNGYGELDGALLQQPQISPAGRYIAITLRGSKRETGIWDLEEKTWTRTGDGCQINWTPDGQAVYWVHPTGNGGSRVFKMAVKGAAAAEPEVSDDERTFIDLPGRRSHEYFPQLSGDEQWLVWAATQRGHDHDIADYEVYLWKVNESPENAARLTFHSGNDRWPDIYLPAAATAAAPKSGQEAGSDGAADPATSASGQLSSQTTDQALVAAEATAAPKAKKSKRKATVKKKRKRVPRRRK